MQALTVRRPSWDLKPADRRKAMILGASAMLHAAVLAMLAFGAFGLVEQTDRSPVPDPIYIQLEPRPLLAGETTRVPAPSLAPRTAETRPFTGARSADAPTLPRPHKTDEDAPSLPAPRQSGAAPAGAPAPAAANPWTYQPETLGAAVGRSMRTGTGGCRIMDGHLNAGEQALCDERFNAGAAAAAARHPLGQRTLTASEQRREAGFAAAGARALAEYESRRGARPGVGVSGASPECVGGNLRGTCAGAYLRPEYQHSEEAPFGGTAAPK